MYGFLTEVISKQLLQQDGGGGLDAGTINEAFSDSVHEWTSDLLCYISTYMSLYSLRSKCIIKVPYNFRVARYEVK